MAPFFYPAIQSFRVYSIPSSDKQTEITIKKSRFIATAHYVDDRLQAMTYIESARYRLPDAGHHCWAYIVGPPTSPNLMAMSDDGEPSGTAGKPILNVLQHKQIGNILVVVSRYFGGVKLGAGGLVRAYSGATQAVIDILPTSQYIPKVTMQVSVGFSQEQNLRHWLSTHQLKLTETHYGEQVNCVFELPEALKVDFALTATERGWHITEPDIER